MAKKDSRKQTLSTADILARLESAHGPQEPCWPTDPYLSLVWWHCGYPASDRACTKGWDQLGKNVGVEMEQILAASPAKLAAALQAGGMVPELRALRLKEIAARVKDEFGGDLRNALAGPIAKVRKVLKTFPNIADPGADRILLFAGVSPVAAVPSNCPHVLVRIRHGRERESYSVTYKEAQALIALEVPENCEARSRAYLLLKKHGQEICKRKPNCPQCVLKESCVFFSGSYRGRGAQTSA